MASLVIVVSAVLVLSCGQTDKQTNRHADADERFTPATLVARVSGEAEMTGVNRDVFIGGRTGAPP